MKTLKESILGSMGMGDKVVLWERVGELINGMLEGINMLFKKEEFKFRVVKRPTTYIDDKEINRINLDFDFEVEPTEDVQKKFNRDDSYTQEIYDKVYDIFNRLKRKSKPLQLSLQKGNHKDFTIVNCDVEDCDHVSIGFFSIESGTRTYDFRLEVVSPEDKLPLIERKITVKF